jgi:hypothetical protein
VTETWRHPTMVLWPHLIAYSSGYLS